MSRSCKGSPQHGAGLLRAILALMTGTVFAQALAMASQFLLAIWLTPSDFGVWAAAMSSLVFLSGLLNLGEVNGYLSGQSPSFAGTRRTTRMVNRVLMLLGLLYAGYCALYRPIDLALLCAAIALTFPIQGESSLLSAAGTKIGSYRAVVSSQMLAAGVKLLLGIVLAAASHSAYAIAISTAAFFAVMCSSLYRRLPRERLHEHDAAAAPKIPLSSRFKWAVNSLMMSLPIQAGYLVAQFLSSMSLLGVYFFSYQITLGISGLVSLPLSRVGLSALAREKDLQKRKQLALWLCTFFSAATLVGVGLISAVGGRIDALPKSWQDALPMTVILLSSLPIRMTAPIVDAIQQANNRWWQATAFNAVDALGTALASVSIIHQDARILALSIAAWKILFGLSRLFIVLSGQSLVQLLSMAVPVVSGSLLIWVSFFFLESSSLKISLASALLGGATLGYCYYSRVKTGND